MTAATASANAATSAARDGALRHARPSAFDRAVVHLSMAMLRWARNRASRSYRSRDELAVRHRNSLDREARERAAILTALRLP
jgi:hypothetical protein